MRKIILITLTLLFTKSSFIAKPKKQEHQIYYNIQFKYDDDQIMHKN
ncbi:hypothetical protein H4V97_001069 [Flavobacterium sp. CG_23.5]|nr:MULTISPECIES: hypothetical protein [unclassified Flavobacterium]MBG6112047.1 hypothetical protein [Flavobacterium sp. CG_9.10]MBP2282751.1 hypothetical protein [Flavobacterium sp. CG_23.5]